MMDTKIRVTEFGWNSKEVDEYTQSNYLIQSILMYMALGVDRTYIYEYYDQPSVPLFSSMGVKGKQAESALIQAYDVLKDYYIVSSFIETNRYLMFNGENYVIAAWGVNSSSELQLFENTVLDETRKITSLVGNDGLLKTPLGYLVLSDVVNIYPVKLIEK